MEIRDDKVGEIGITSGEKEGELIKPISLSYEFVLRNSGKNTLGGIAKPNNETYEFDDGIKLVLEPNEKLTTVIKEIAGFNIYNEEGREEARLGLGKTSTPVLEPNQEGKYTLDFVLGAIEENPEIRIAPPQEQLDELIKNAMEATLVIYIEEEEIARFDIVDSNK